MRVTNDAILGIARFVLILMLFCTTAGVVATHIAPSGVVLADEGTSGKEHGKEKNDKEKKDKQSDKGKKGSGAERVAAQNDDDDDDEDGDDGDDEEGNGNGQGNRNNRGEGDDDDGEGRDIVVVRDVTPIPQPTAVSTPVPEADAAGTLRVVAMACADTPGKDSDWEAACARPENGARFELTGIDGPFAEWSRDLTAGADGVATLDELPPARYSLVQVDAGWCRAESDRVDDSGNIVIQDGQVTTVWIYNCPLNATAP